MSQTLFATLAENNIIDGSTAYTVLDKLDVFEAIELLGKCCNSIGIPDNILPSTMFTFAPVSSVAGGQHPCESGQCRIETAYSLSLFGAMYSDQIILPNFFDYFHHLIQKEQYPFSNESQEERFKYNLMNDIAVCYQYKPLIDAGLAHFNHTTPSICAECYKDRISESKKFEQGIAKNLDAITPLLRKKIKFILTDTDYVAIEDVENYVGGELGWVLKKDYLKYMTKRARQIPHSLNRNEIERMGLFDKIIKDTVDDLLEYHFYPDLAQATYLTDRQLDVELIEASKSSAVKTLRQGSNGIYHNLPFLQDVLIEDLVRLRNDESKSFEIYRDTITDIVRNEDQHDVEDLVTKKLNPALNKIDALIEHNKRHYKARAGKKLIQSTTIASVGFAASNMFNIPSELLSVASYAGLFSGADILNDKRSGDEIPLEAINNQYYYLWKAKKIAHTRA